MSREVPEWIADHDDQNIPPRVKVRVAKRAGDKCAICTLTIGGKLKPAFDHILAICNGGEHRESNLQLLCVPCHKVKTGADVAEKARDQRKRLKHLGIKKPRSIRKWRRFNGTGVIADRER